jgi:hypothetical protein
MTNKRKSKLLVRIWNGSLVDHIMVPLNYFEDGKSWITYLGGGNIQKFEKRSRGSIGFNKACS